MPHVLIDSRTLADRIQELARELRRDAGPGVALHMVAVLKGAFMFLADLLRALDGPVTCDFIALSSYGMDTSTSGEVQLTKDLDQAVAGRDVVIVEDIVDTGVTLTYLQDILRARGPRSLRTMCLLSKPSRRQVEVPVEYIGFTIEDAFVVGYGLDFEERFRNLPHIAVLNSASAAPSR